MTRIGVGFSSSGLTPGASGIALPIVTPRGGGTDPKARVVTAIRACAP